VSRTTDDVVRDLEMIACQGIGTPHLKDRTAQRVRELTEEACALATAQQRKATARAWSAWLDLMMTVQLPGAGGKSLLQDVLDLEPGLRARFEAAFPGVPRA